MALDTYSNLKTTVQDWSHRNDVANKMDDFILITEQEMYNNAVEPLIVREQEFRATADTTTTTRYIALPNGFTRMRRILIDDKSTDPCQFEMRYYTPEVLPISSRSGMPSAFTVTSQIELDRVPDAVYNLEMQYFATPTPLSASNPTNDILTNYPSIYLYGSLWALNRWANEDTLAANYYNDFMNAIRGANQADDLGRYGPASFMRIEGPVV